MDNPSRRPLQMALMGFRHVFGNSGVAVFAVTPQMTGHPTVFVKDRNGCGRHAYVELLSPQLVWNAVIVAVNLHMVIDIGGRLFPLGELIAMGRQWGQRRPVDGFEKMMSGSFHSLQRPLVEHRQLLSDRLIEFSQREESVVPQCGQDPSFGDQYGGLHLGLGIVCQLHIVTHLEINFFG
jgi:hypothetical protein